MVILLNVTITAEPKSKYSNHLQAIINLGKMSVLTETDEWYQVLDCHWKFELILTG